MVYAVRASLTTILIMAMGLTAPLAAPRQPKAPDSTDDRAAIYRLVFERLFPNSLPPLTVDVRPLSIPSIARMSPDWRAQFDDVPEPLRKVALSGREEPLDRHASLAFPLGTALRPRETLVAPASSSVPWQRPSSSTWQAFSLPVLSPTGLDALLYYEHHCGARCGHGAYVWLHRDRPSGTWRIEKHVPSAVG